MFEKPIQDILTARLQQLPELVMEADLGRDIDALVARILPTGRVAVVDDTRTAAAHGDRVFRALSGAYEACHVTLDGNVKADDAALAEVEAKTARADLLVAVGSGTISDLAKLASFKAKKPYVIFPTAASMNGYVSKNASITVKGKKESVPAQLPAAVFADMKVIGAAPARLNRAGLGDSLARPTAQADWLLSHHLLGTPFEEDVFRLNGSYEAMVFAQAAGIAHADREVMQALVKLILLSGFGMTIAQSSAPASGSEHMIAHLLSTHATLHGEEIAVTAVDMAARQQQMLAKNSISLRRNTHEKKRELIEAHLPGYEVPKALWEQARAAIAAIHMAPEALAKIREKCGLPDMPQKLGWSEQDYRAATDAAYATRDRFTCLDVEF